MVGLKSPTNSSHPPDVKKSTSKRIGVYGGTFDPVHIGHLILAQDALCQLNLDCVLWVLTPKSPFKVSNRITDIQTRLDLLEVALENNPQFQISFVDINRPPPHYAVDTLKALKIDFPNEKLVYLLGLDSLIDLPTWHNPQQLVTQVDAIGVMHRHGFQIDIGELDKKLPGVSTKINWIETPIVEISSTKIREKIRHKEAYRYYLHPGVYKIICDRNLYFEN